MFRLVVVPLDGTPFAERALPTAIMLARAGGRLLLARVHVLHAPTTEAEALTLPDPATLRAIEAAAREDLDSATRRVAAHAGVPVDSALVRAASPHQGLYDLAAERGADLIVMASHERSALDRLFLGSTAERVAREPGVPVLIVHAPEAGPGTQPDTTSAPAAVADRAAGAAIAPAAPFRRVLIPLDGSPVADAVVEPATRLARACGAAVTLLTVHDPFRAAASVPEHAASPEHMERVAERLRAHGLAVELRELADRDIAHGIARCAADVGADVIAIGTHGHGALARLLGGSVAAGVLHTVPMPVLVLRAAIGDRTPATADPPRG